MMDDLINNAQGAVENLVSHIPGLDGIMDSLKDKAADFGLSSETFDELSAKAKELMADGALSAAEVAEQVKAFAQEKGIPTGIIDTVMGMLPQKESAE